MKLAAPPPAVETGSTQKLDPIAAVALVIGSILGSGIFVAPSLIARFSHSLWVASLFWLLGGLACAAGAMIYGSLGLRFPQGGGQYIYLRETMGKRYSQLYGWMSILVICPTMLAGTALYFSELLSVVMPPAARHGKLIAVSLLAFFTLLNSFGLRLAGSFQKWLVVLHVTLFLAAITLSFCLLPNHELNSYLHAPLLSGAWVDNQSLERGVLAFAAVLWTFEGFNAITFITNEIKDGERNVRRVSIIGCLIVMAIYLLFNFVVLANIPLNAIANQTNSASFLMSAVFGPRAAWVVFSVTALGVVTVLHASALIGPRLSSATLRDSKLLRSYMSRHPEAGAPIAVLWFQFIAAAFYVLTGHFEALITAFAVLNWMFYGLTAIGFYKLCLRSLGTSKALPKQFLIDSACVLLFLAIVFVLLASQALVYPKTTFFGILVFVCGLYVTVPKPRMKLNLPVDVEPASE